MSVVHKSKSQVREETAKAVELFLKRGGVVKVIETKKKAPPSARTWMKR